MTAGALVLAISAVFATKANKKFLGFVYATITNGTQYFSYASKIFTTHSNAAGVVPVYVAIYTEATTITGNKLVLNEADGSQAYVVPSSLP